MVGRWFCGSAFHDEADANPYGLVKVLVLLLPQPDRDGRVDRAWPGRETSKSREADGRDVISNGRQTRTGCRSDNS